MTLTRYERETSISMNDEDDYALITTYQRRMLTKLRRNPAARLVETHPHDGTDGATFSVPAALVGVRNPRLPRKLSAEHRAASAAGLEMARAARKTV